MEEDLLIDFNASPPKTSEVEIDLTVTSGYVHKTKSVDQCIIYGMRSSESEEPLMDFDTVLEGIPPKEKSEEKCLLYSDPSELLSPFTCTTSKASQTVDLNVLTRSDHAESFSPFSNAKENARPQFATESDTSKLISPFRGSPKVTIHEVGSGESSVPTGNLLQIQDPQVSTSLSKDSNQESGGIAENSRIKNSLMIPSIPSIGSGESVDTMNKAFMEISTNLENGEEWLEVNDSVFEEAQALSVEFRKLAQNALNSPYEAIEDEDLPMVELNDTDLYDMEMKVDAEEVKRRLKSFLEEKDDEDQRKVTGKNEQNPDASLNTDEPVGSRQSNETSTMSGCTVSPLPLSTNRLDRIKLRAASVIGVPLKFSNLKGSASNNSSSLSAKSGPLKALIPLEDMIKDTPNLKVKESSPLMRENNLNVGILSSTPKFSHLNNLSAKSSATRKELSVYNIKQANSNIHSDVTSTPSRPRTSSFGRVHDVQRGKSNIKTLLPARPKTTVGQSPLSIKKPGNVTAGSKTNSIVRSSSVGNLPHTPSLKKSNTSPQCLALQNSLKRSNSLSMRPLQNKIDRPSMIANANSPKQNTPRTKMMSKFRRSIASGEMKENLTPKH